MDVHRGFHRPADPGRPSAYYETSEYGYELIDAVIERVSGQDCHDYIDEHVFGEVACTHFFAELPVSS